MATEATSTSVHPIKVLRQPSSTSESPPLPATSGPSPSLRSVSSYFYSQPPTHRTRKSIIKLDSKIWGSIALDSEEDEEEEDRKSGSFRRKRHRSPRRESEETEDRRRRRKERKREDGDRKSDGSREHRKRRCREEEDSGYDGTEPFDDEAQSSKRTKLEEDRLVRLAARNDETDGGQEVDRSPPDPVTTQSTAIWPIHRVPLDPPVSSAPSSRAPRQSSDLSPSDLTCRRTLSTSLVYLYKQLRLTSLSPIALFEPFLTDELLPPSRSHAFHQRILRFCAYCAPPAMWDFESNSNLYIPSTVPLARAIQERVPNFEMIRRNYPLESTFVYQREGSDSIVGNAKLSCKVADWLWGKRVRIEELRWIVEQAPLPLFALLLEHVSVSRYIQAVEYTRSRFTNFLNESIVSIPSYELGASREASTPKRIARAKMLWDWLNEGDGKRIERFFAPDSRSREGVTIYGQQHVNGGRSNDEETWRWWFEDLERGEPKERTVEELDRWEETNLGLK